MTDHHMLIIPFNDAQGALEASKLPNKCRANMARDSIAAHWAKTLADET
jgi:hypothetical protein